MRLRRKFNLQTNYSLTSTVSRFQGFVSFMLKFQIIILHPCILIPLEVIHTALLHQRRIIIRIILEPNIRMQ